MKKTKKRGLAENPFFRPFMAEHEVIPFDKIERRHFLPAIVAAMREARANLRAIKENKDGPDFDNTVLALETCDERLRLVSSALDVFSSALSDKIVSRIDKKARIMMTKFYDELSLDDVLFSRLKRVYETRHSLSLDPEQLRLAEEQYKSFVRNGALLGEKQKVKLKKINERLSELSSIFKENVLAATNDFALVIGDKSELAGLPEAEIETAALEAKKRGESDGAYVLTLKATCVTPVMQYADNRELRKKMLIAFRSRAFGGKYDNTKVVKEIAALRFKRARLLGYETHARFVLANRMAETPEKVTRFLGRYLKRVRPAAKKELRALEKFARGLGGPEKLESWDTAYWAEKLQKAKYDFDTETLRPYFKLENVINGVFGLAEKLYGVKFRSVTVPVYHPDVKTHEVIDADGRYLGLFYADFHPRESKRAGAWANSIRDQGLFEGKIRRPHASILCNFTESTPTKPSLLTFDETRTFLHEFGHALHLLFSDCAYASLSSFNALWDFIELPSQIMENWLMEKDVLDLFARHYQTGAKIPPALIKKIKESETFMAGRAALRQLDFAYLDMAWHNGDPRGIGDIAAFELKAGEKTSIMARTPGICVSCSFAHIFTGGYAAGYYSYKWAEVLEADAFAFIKAKGIFDKKIMRKFREKILSQGNKKHPLELYVDFLGREAKIEPLLEREGLIR